MRVSFASLLAIALAIAFSWPLLANLSATGIWDWTEAAGHYEASRNTLFYYGQFPLWNPYMCGGAPAWNNPQSYWMSLTWLLTLPFGVVAGTKLAVAVYLVIGCLGAWKLAVLLGLKKPAMYLVAPLYLMNGFVAVHLAGGQFLWLTLAWVPWVIWCYLKSQRNRWWLVLGALVFAMIGWEGRSYLIAYMLVLLGVQAVCADLLERKVFWIKRASILIGLAFLLGAWKFIPDLYFLFELDSSLKETVRWPVWDVVQRLWDRDLVGAESEVGQLLLVEYGLYVGVLAVILAWVGFWNMSRKLLPWMVAAGVLAFVALAPNQWSILEKVPVLSELRNPQRALSVVLLWFGVLAVIGLHNIVYVFVSHGLRRTVTWVVMFLIVADLLIVSSAVLNYGLVVGEESDNEKPEVTWPILQTNGKKPYATIVQNRGASKFCPAVLKPWWPVRKFEGGSWVEGVGQENYRGEAWVVGQGRIINYQNSPNKILATIESEEAVSLVFNQNWDVGWRSNQGEIKKTGRSLLSVNLPAGEHIVELSYWPKGLSLGIGVSAVTALVLLMALWKDVGRKNSGRFAGSRSSDSDLSASK